MTITAYGRGARAAQTSSDLFGGIKGTLGTLQQQLSSGRVASTYAGLGSGAATSLQLNARLSTSQGYASAIGGAQTRVNLASSGLQHISSLAHELGSLGAQLSLAPPISVQSSQIAANGDLAEAVDVLNSDVNGVYLFSGRTADTQPVTSTQLILDGDGTRAALRDLVAQRKAADLGSAGLGRLTVASSGTSVTLAEEAAGLPFGLKIAGASVVGSGLAAANAAGPPASATVTVATQPAAGTQLTIGLTLPDGTATSLQLSARVDDGKPAPAGTFNIGATAADTAANLQAALGGTLQTTATTTLAAASALKASTDFFAGSTAAPPPRVSGPPYDTATALVAGTADNTVIFYLGDDSAGSARATAPVKVGDDQTLGIGLRANEAPLQSVLAAFGALAADTFPAGDPTATARFTALSAKVSGLLLGSTGASGVDAITTDLANASTALAHASDRVAAKTAQIQNALDPIENISPETVAEKLLDTQTRLQASYQVTSTISKLSLTDFL